MQLKKKLSDQASACAQREDGIKVSKEERSCRAGLQTVRSSVK